MSFNRRQVIWAAASLAAGTTYAQISGSKPLTLVVPFAPGGNADIVARSISLPMGKLLGQAVIVDNRGGGGGAIGTALAARAIPDGNTLLAATPGQLGTLPNMFKTSYKRTDLVPVGILSKTSMALIVRRGDSRFKSVEELIAYAKSNPGKVNVGHAGPGSPNHLALLQFENSANCRFTAISYKGSGPALLDLLSSQVDVVVDQVSSSLPHLKAQSLSALIVLGPTRDSHLAGVRTLKESGLAEFDASTYIGLLAPKGVPLAIIERLTATVQQVAVDSAFDQGLKAIGSTAFYADSKQFEEIIKADEQLALALIKQGRLVNE